MLPIDFFNRSYDMSQTSLPVGSGTVIGGIAVAYQCTIKVLSEDGFCHLGRPMPVDMKEGEVFSPCGPHIMVDAVTAS